MSTWFSQNIVYGYKTTYEEFEKHVDEEDFDAWDEAMAENREDETGWVVDDNFVVYGKILLSGESYGNDTLLAAEKGLVEVPKLENTNELLSVHKKIDELFPDAKPEDIKYYITGQYS